jgi:lysophospholipase L1-like esterase
LVGHALPSGAKLKRFFSGILCLAALGLFAGCGRNVPYTFELLDTSPSGSPFSRVHFIANGAVAVTTDCSIFPSYPRYAETSLTVNGRETQVFYCSAAVPQTFRATPPAGSSVEIISGPRIRLTPAAAVTGDTIQAVVTNALKSVEPKKPLVVVYGDSIASGFGTDVPSRDAWTVLLRQTYSVGVEAWGARELHSDYVAGLDALISYFASYGDPETIWLAIGVNDCIAGVDPVEFQNEYGALLDAVHSSFPAARVFAQTPLILADETTNVHLYAPSVYRAAIADVCARRTFCKLVDGPAILSVADLNDDGVHPTTAGNLKYETYVLKTIH